MDGLFSATSIAVVGVSELEENLARHTPPDSTAKRSGGEQPRLSLAFSGGICPWTDSHRAVSVLFPACIQPWIPSR